MKEVEAYALFAPHPNIIRAIDHSIVADRSDPGAKTVYILLPYYRRGNLQDIINANLVNGTKFEEKDLMMLFLGVCRALRRMHGYTVEGENGNATKSKTTARRIRDEAEAADRELAEREGEDTEQVQQPLMDGEVTRAQDGLQPGQARAYAHRDIKPGTLHTSHRLGKSADKVKATL